MGIFCTTEPGRGGLAAMEEFVCCMGTLALTIGDEWLWGVPWRSTGDWPGICACAAL